MIVTAEREVAFYKAPRARLERTAHVRAVPALARLGPELLDDDCDLDEVVRRAMRQPGRPIGELLLDQSVAAGIGHVYKSEAMFMRRLDPWARADALADGAVRAVFALARDPL